MVMTVVVVLMVEGVTGVVLGVKVVCESASSPALRIGLHRGVPGNVLMPPIIYPEI